MAKKTLKLVDPNDPASAISPPRPLGEHGQRLWQGDSQEYDISDVGGREMLAQACAALDRAEACATIIAEQGGWSNEQRTARSPAAEGTSLAAAASPCARWQRLGLDVEPIGRVGRPTVPWGLR